jgi:hypothetical protein
MNFLTLHMPTTGLEIKTLQPRVDSVMLAPMASQWTTAKESAATSCLELQYFLASSSCVTLYTWCEIGIRPLFPELIQTRVRPDIDVFFKKYIFIPIHCSIGPSPCTFASCCR